MKIIKNQHLVDSWLVLGNQLMSVRSIFQFNENKHVEELIQWKKKVIDIQDQITQLTVDSLKYIYSFEECKQFVVMGNHNESDCKFVEKSFDSMQEARDYIHSMLNETSNFVDYEIVDLNNVQ